MEYFIKLAKYSKPLKINLNQRRLDMHIGKYIDLVHRTEVDLVKAFTLVANAHGDEVDVYQTCMLLSRWSQSLADEVQVFAEKYGEEKDSEPDRLTQTLLKKTRQRRDGIIKRFA